MKHRRNKRYRFFSLFKLNVIISLRLYIQIGLFEVCGTICAILRERQIHLSEPLQQAHLLR